MSDIEYCPKCGGTGIDINGKPCTCRFSRKLAYNAVSCLDVPKQYLGIQFRKEQVPQDCGDYYPAFLDKFYQKLLNLQYENYNMCICSPIAHSKTVLAYSAINELFRQGIKTFPVCNVFEIQTVMKYLETGYGNIEEFISTPENLFKAPYVFVKIPLSTTWNVYATIIDILDRRVRRGLSTFFLYDGTWENLIYADKNNILPSIKGNGYYESIDVHSFNKQISDSEAFETMLRERRQV